ncbi:hypothetical protein MTQ00_08315 [Chryseobacterium sp. B21-037]|uniref:hypothetical protein n=1 Tax=Chryseobacterium sp. B21-037 TaxID=2926038 RepID=UPI002358CA44|nr:hypothetical protein [Chryseobacterium sp. B21-037]MDC8104541.1 hypothetical protein [Chryseobacterium sp. B21-037]
MKTLKFKHFQKTEMRLTKEFDNPKVLFYQKSNQHLYFENQLKIIFQYLQNNIATASMTATATGIPQKNICRYKRHLEKAGKLWEVEKKECEETGVKAWYLTTNPKYLSKFEQLSLF